MNTVPARPLCWVNCDNEVIIYWVDGSLSPSLSLPAATASIIRACPNSREVRDNVLQYKDVLIKRVRTIFIARFFFKICIQIAQGTLEGIRSLHYAVTRNEFRRLLLVGGERQVTSRRQTPRSNGRLERGYFGAPKYVTCFPPAIRK